MRPNRKESSRTREKGMHPGPRWNSSVAFHNFAWKMASPYIYRRGEARIRDEQDLFSRPRNVIMKTCADVIDYPIAVARLNRDETAKRDVTRRYPCLKRSKFVEKAGIVSFNNSWNLIFVREIKEECCESWIFRGGRTCLEHQFLVFLFMFLFVNILFLLLLIQKIFMIFHVF